MGKLGEGVQYALLRAFLPEAGVPTHVTTKGMVAILGHWADHDPPYYEKYFSATRHQCDLAVKTLWEELGETNVTAKSFYTTHKPHFSLLCTASAIADIFKTKEEDRPTLNAEQIQLVCSESVTCESNYCC